MHPNVKSMLSLIIGVFWVRNEVFFPTELAARDRTGVQKNSWAQSEEGAPTNRSCQVKSTVIAILSDLVLRVYLMLRVLGWELEASRIKFV